MSKQGNRKELNRKWLGTMAELEDRCSSVSVGGMAYDVGLLHTASLPEIPRIFGRLIEFARRAERLSLEDLATKADIDLLELVAIESDDDVAPQARSVYRLALALQLAPSKLMEISGLQEVKDESLSRAAVRFAAQSECNAELSADEVLALNEFVKVLADNTDTRS